MARGRDRFDAHVAAVHALGKDLSRRAGSVCELCGGGDDLRVLEVPPVDEEPDVDAAMLACARCRDVIEVKKLPADTTDLRFLEGAVWADPVPVKVAAIRLLRRLADHGAGWASECLDGVWIPEEVEERLGG
jgi:protein PhnA